MSFVATLGIPMQKQLELKPKKFTRLTNEQKKELVKWLLDRNMASVLVVGGKHTFKFNWRIMGILNAAKTEMKDFKVTYAALGSAMKLHCLFKDEKSSDGRDEKIKQLEAVNEELVKEINKFKECLTEIIRKADDLLCGDKQ